MTGNFWTRSVNRHLAAWAGAAVEAFPAYDFAEAEANGVAPRDAAQEAIDAAHMEGESIVAAEEASELRYFGLNL